MLLDNIIKYYAKVTDAALNNLSNGKTFQFRKYLTNHSLLKVVESHYDSIDKSEASRKLVNEYMTAMNSMTIHAKNDYNLALKKFKAAAGDKVLQQSILNEFANNGITGFVSKNGARWNIETYSNMYSRHVNNEILRIRELNKIKERKESSVLISSHGTVCDICKKYEGRILTLMQLDAAREDGLFHPNCLHFILPVGG